MSQEIANNFESKVNVSIETNTKGHNTKITIYQGVSDKEISETIDKAVKGHNELQNKLAQPQGVKE